MKIREFLFQCRSECFYLYRNRSLVLYQSSLIQIEIHPHSKHLANIFQFTLTLSNYQLTELFVFRCISFVVMNPSTQESTDQYEYALQRQRCSFNLIQETV